MGACKHSMAPPHKYLGNQPFVKCGASETTIRSFSYSWVGESIRCVSYDFPQNSKPSNEGFESNEGPSQLTRLCFEPLEVVSSMQSRL